MDQGDQNFIWAHALADALAQSGVRWVVLSPGSRSTPLNLACVRHPKLHTWVFPDERSGAFFALGISKVTGIPTTLIATSGTAPSNWYPAVIEAAQDTQPLILISADRPMELQDCGANQTIDQTRLFGVYTRAFYALPHVDIKPTNLRMVGDMVARAVDRSQWPLAGPVHINVPLRDPLVPSDRLPIESLYSEPIATIRYPNSTPKTEDVTELAMQISGKQGLVVCGRGPYAQAFPRALCELARGLSWPVLADPLSGLRFGQHDRTQILGHYDAFLRKKAFCKKYRPNVVLRFGGTPTSQVLQQYLNQIDKGATILVDPLGLKPDPTRTSGMIFHTDAVALCQQLTKAITQSADSMWCRAFLEKEQSTAQRLQDLVDRPLEAEVMEKLVYHCPNQSIVFCGNSMVVRDVDSFLSGGEQVLTLVGNRGASGIDGNVSTTLGMAAVSDKPVIGLVGDLALFHDMNGLLAAKGLNAVLVVFNNGGGAIFEYLPQADLPEFETYWLTPPALDIAQIARLYSLNHHCIQDAEQFETALLSALDSSGVKLIEVLVDRKESVRRHKAYWETVVQ